MVIIPPLSSTQGIVVAEFIALRTYASKTDPGTLIAISNWVQPITYQGITFDALGPAINVGQQIRQLKNSQAETNLTLVGIDPAYVQLILSGIAKGGSLQVWRGFFNSTYTLQNNTLYQRYSGIVTNWTIQETFDDKSQSRTCTLVVSSASLDSFLDAINGRFTNSQSWKSQGSSTDTGMDRVASLQNVYFNFGQKVS